MKPFAVLTVIVIAIAFVIPVSAQTLTPGQYAATAFVAKAQEQADKVRRRIDAPTATPRPTSTPTEIPTATYTPMPTATSLPTATNAAQPTREALVVTVKVEVTVKGQMTQQSGTPPQPAWWVPIVAILGAVGFVIWLWLRGAQPVVQK